MKSGERRQIYRNLRYLSANTVIRGHLSPWRGSLLIYIFLKILSTIQREREREREEKVEVEEDTCGGQRKR